MSSSNNRIALGKFSKLVDRSSHDRNNICVYSISKHDGFVKSDDYFKKRVYSEDTSKYKVVIPGDFAFSPIHLDEGSIALAFEPALISPMYKVFEIDNSVCNKKYLIRMLKSPKMIALYGSLGDGSVHRRRSVPFDRLSKLEIYLPTLDEQQRIAVILDQADALRQKRKRALDLIDGLIQSIFFEMFGDVDHNHHNLPVVDLGAVIEDGPNNGLYKPSSDYGAGAPILRINNFYEGEIVDLENLRRLKVNDDELSRFEIKESDIVINRVNSREHVGKSAIVPQLSERAVYESNMMRFRVRKSLFLPEYCIQSLQTPSVRRQIQAKTKDAINQSSINQKDVRSLRVPLPPIEKQRRFAQARNKLLSIRISQRIDAIGAQNLFASLQHQAFFGQL